MLTSEAHSHCTRARLTIFNGQLLVRSDDTEKLGMEKRPATK